MLNVMLPATRSPLSTYYEWWLAYGLKDGCMDELLAAIRIAIEQEALTTNQQEHLTTLKNLIETERCLASLESAQFSRHLRYKHARSNVLRQRIREYGMGWCNSTVSWGEMLRSCVSSRWHCGSASAAAWLSSMD